MKSKIAIIAIVLYVDFLPKSEAGIVTYANKVIHKNHLHPELSGQSYTNYHFDPTITKRKSSNNQFLHDETTKLFNVGYTIRFAEPPRRNSDVVFGARVPNDAPQTPQEMTSNREEIVFNEFLDGKKRKLSGIKPKYRRPLTHGLDTKHLLAIANLSPKTQMKLEELRISEPATSVPKPSMAPNPEWKSLGYGVEIYRSNSNAYPASDHNYQVNSRNGFNHDEALKKSIPFDESNVVSAQYGRHRRYYL